MTRTERVARAFHDAYERLAPQFSYSTRKASAVPGEQVPENNRKLMIATVAEVLTAIDAERDALREALAASLAAMEGALVRKTTTLTDTSTRQSKASSRKPARSLR